ncbi:glycosyltransferase family 4 protein [Nocardioides plantarum]|uniref:Glycosyltransferase family 4 protein n=1 Tax=Nocardioides plantarum TaxID=29299 RepID=A0ABV5K784_9ACTN|nr:glycosyltransferase family 4 protein [Nocardioides plantarum]
MPWHPLIAASVARRHLDQGPGHALRIARRVLPARARSVLPAPSSDRASATREWPTVAATQARRSGRRRRAARLQGEVAALRPDLRPDPRTAAAPSPGPRHAPVRARADVPVGVTHLVTAALPETVAGYTVRTHRIARAQAAAGHRVQVVTRLGFPVTRGHLRADALVALDGVDYRRLLATLPARADHGLARDASLTQALVEQAGAGVLHAHSTHVNAQVALTVGGRLGVPVVYEVRGFQEETRRSADPDRTLTEHYRLTRDAETWCARHADAVVTLSPSMRDELVARGIDGDRIHLAPNAVDEAWLRVDDADRAAAAALRASLGFADDDLVVAAVGTLNAYEGLDVLVGAIGLLASEAAASTTPGGPTVRLLVVGNGPERDRLARLAEGLPVTLLGAVPPDDVRRWLLAADVSALPRLDLPVTRLVPPLKPVEAMALGRPVVASDLPPTLGLVRDGETGLRVAPGDPVALAAALRTLATDPDLRRRLGRAAAEHVAATHTWSAVASLYSDLYTQLIHQREETPA